MIKKALIQSLKGQLEEQYRRSIAAVEGAHEAATGDDTKAEGKYDTRALEASYLAAGQAEQADELARGVAAVNACQFPEFQMDDPVGPGALVECDQEGELVYFLLAPGGGGMVCREPKSGISATVLGPEAPLREKLMGKTPGQSTDDPHLLILEVM